MQFLIRSLRKCSLVALTWFVPLASNDVLWCLPMLAIAANGFSVVVVVTRSSPSSSKRGSPRRHSLTTTKDKHCLNHRKRGLFQRQAHQDHDEEEDDTLSVWRDRREALRSQFLSSLPSTNASTSDLQRQLVQSGHAFAAKHQRPVFETPTNSLEKSGIHQSVSQPTKVTGCIANVVIQVVMLSGSSLDETNTKHDNLCVQICGTCDALLSSGLLALWCQQCHNQSPHSVLQQDPHTLADAWGLRSALSPGRNDGLASLVRTTQALIRDQLRVLEQGDEDSETKKTMKNVLPAQDSLRMPQRRRPTVALLLSGGVDSSVALFLLLQQGYNVTAFYLKIWLEDEVAHLGECPWEADVRMCQQVCEHASQYLDHSVPLVTVSLQQEYHQHVVAHALKEARAARTPNPDILCNARIKFGCFYEYLSTLLQEDNRPKFDHVATGHYAQLVRDGDVVRLHRAPDPVKDQSYFLCALTQDQLQRVRFPIGHLHKSEVRQLANEFQLPNRHRPDSQGLCFLGKVKFSDFVGSYLGERPGTIVDAVSGQVIGRHRGVWFHTVGQRKGLGPHLIPQYSALGPWYVVAKDPQRDIVYCSNRYDDTVFQTARRECTVEHVSWIAGQPPEGLDNGLCLDLKIRHGPKIVSGLVQKLDQQDEYSVVLDAKDGGLAPGQFVVFYKPNATECLGGGVISERHWAQFLWQTPQQTTTEHQPLPPVQVPLPS